MPIRPVSICIVTGIFPPDIGGPAHYVPRLAEALQARGHAVSVVSLADAPAEPVVCPYPLHRIARATRLPHRWLRTVSVVRRAARGADLIYVNGLSSEATLAALSLGLPTVHKIVGDYAWERARNRGWYAGTIDDYQTAPKGLRFRLLDAIRTLPLRHARAVVVPSDYLGRIVAGWGVPADRIRRVYNATEPPTALPDGRLLPPFEGATIATVGRLVPWKGIAALIRVMAHLPVTRLAIAGDGPLRADLEALAAEVGVAERVLFLGNVAKPDVFRLLRESRLFVLNSSYEGLPHVVLEAFAAGTPVIATDVGGTGEVVTHDETGVLIPAGDEDALLAALTRLLGDKALASRLGRGGAAALQTSFAFATMVNETEAVLVAGQAAAIAPLTS